MSNDINREGNPKEIDLTAKRPTTPDLYRGENYMTNDSYYNEKPTPDPRQGGEP